MTNPSNPTWLERMAELERAARIPEETEQSKACPHKRTQIWEPHLAGTRKCVDCGKVRNPNHGDKWFFERSEQADKIFLEASREFVPKALECIKDLKSILHEIWDDEDMGLSIRHIEIFKKWGLD